MGDQTKTALYFVGGLAIGVIIAKMSVKKKPVETIQKGDKSKDVLLMQKLINESLERRNSKERVKESGTADKMTTKKAKEVFDGTNAMVNGAIVKDFINDTGKVLNIVK